MNFEFPFNLVAKTPAKASEVMANLNKIKALLEGGLDQSIFSESGRILMGQVDNTIQPTVNAPRELFALGNSTPIVVPAASKMLLVCSADMEVKANFGGENQKVSGRVTAYLDGNPTDAYVECGNQSPQVTGTGISGVGATKVQSTSSIPDVISIGAGTHQVLLNGQAFRENAFGSPTVTFWKARVAYIIVPN